MRLAVRVFGLALIAAIGLVACASAAPTATAKPAAATVSMKGFAFAPATLELAKGAVVTWTNEDSVAHTVTSGTPPPTPVPTASPAPGAPTPTRAPGPSPTLPKGDGRIESGRIENLKTFSFTFNEAGTFDYFCAIHPRMVAKITVK